MRARSSERGVTLTELMIAMIVITIGVLGLMQSFSFISRSLRISRQRTIAVNLAQEKIESLKQLSYSRLLVTTSTIVNTNFTPSLTYDAANYPPETLSLWGGSPLTRATYVSFAAVNNGVVTPLPWTSTDPGLKKITTYVFWNQDGAWRSISLTNLLENPSISSLNSTISGTVSQSGGGALPGALVQVIGSPQWKAVTDASGNYNFSVSAGSYTLNASSSGYYSQMSGSVSAPSGGSATNNFTLSLIATGTVASASVYIDSALVVSQVVTSTVTQGGDGALHDIEYVELFNPTPQSIPVGQAGTAVVQLNYVAQSGLGGSQANFPLVYVSTYVPPQSYYLIASATNMFVAGGWVAADAYYGPALGLYQNVIPRDKSGAIQLADSTGKVFDGLGWSAGGAPGAPWAEGNPVTVIGGPQTGQFVRMSSACTLNDSYGRAYEPFDNSNSFVYNVPIAIPPRNTSTSRTVISGIPAFGGFAGASDGNSSAAAMATGTAVWGAQTCPYASFSVVGVATGTWTVQVSSGVFSQTVSNVASAQGATTWILNGATSPPSPSGFAYVALTSTTTNGYVSGTVSSAGGGALSGITVSGGGGSTVTGAGGGYFLSTSNGAVTVTANPNNLNPNYVAQSALVTVNTGQVANQSFILSQGGVVQGYVTTGLSPLAGIVVSASGGGGQSGTSDSTGNFYITNLTTGTYTLSPALDPSQAASPASLTATLSTPGTTVFAGTFTVSGAYATISGTVQNNGAAITTGVLVVASSVTVPDPAPAIYASSSAANAPYYAATSRSDGTYSVLVRGSTTYSYNVRAYFPVVNLNTGAATSTSKTSAGISAPPGGSVPNQNFAWP